MTHPILSKLFAFGAAAVLGGAMLAGSGVAHAEPNRPAAVSVTEATVAADPPGAARRALRAEIHDAHEAVVRDRVEPGEGEPRGLWGLQRWEMHEAHMDGQEAMRDLRAAD